MKRTLAALVLLLCLASCQRGIKTNVFTDEMKLPLAEGCQDTLSVQILLEYPVGEDSVSQAMNRSILDIAGEHDGADGNIMVISQFTLFASYKKGNRPSWLRAATHDISIPLYEAFIHKLSEAIGRPIGHGEFGADMKVSLCNDGPVTIMMDTHNKE